jgi:hypothetical protein
MREQQAPEAFKKIVEYDVAKTGSQTGLAYQNKDVREQGRNDAGPSSSQLVQNSLSRTKQDGAALVAPVARAVGQRGRTAATVRRLVHRKTRYRRRRRLLVWPSRTNAPLYYRQTAPVQVAPVEQKLERGVERLPTLKQDDPMAGRVLSRFTVEQRGQTIRFVDAEQLGLRGTGRGHTRQRANYGRRS